MGTTPSRHQCQGKWGRFSSVSISSCRVGTHRLGSAVSAFQAAEWALTGYHRVAKQRARIEALHNNGGMPYIQQDYDSVIGYTSSIPARAAIFLYMRPHSTRALTARLKVKVPFKINGQASHSVFHLVHSWIIEIVIFPGSHAGPIHCPKHSPC
jgi:hypothetical protein